MAVYYMAIVKVSGEIFGKGLYKSHTEAHLAARSGLIDTLSEAGFDDKMIDLILSDDSSKGEDHGYEVVRGEINA